MSSLQDRQEARLLSIDTLIAWSEKKPANKSFDYGNTNGTCYFSQYLNANGYRGHLDWSNTKGMEKGHSLWMRLHHKFGNCAYAPYRNTFGVVTLRLKKYREQMKKSDLRIAAG